MFSKAFSIFFIFSALLFAASQSAYAQDAPSSAKDTKYGLNDVGTKIGSDNLPFAGETDAGDKLPSVIGNIIKIVLSLLGIIFLVLVIYGGFKWMFAGGDSGEVTEAREIIVHAIIGLIIIASAYTITSFVLDRLSEISTLDA